MPRKLTNEEFVAKLQNIQPKIIPFESYVNAYTTIKCMCIKHNELCYSTPKRLLKGHYCCKKCISEHKRDRLLRTHDEFLQELKDKKVYTIGRYGAWIYNSMEDSMVVAKELAESNNK